MSSRRLQRYLRHTVQVEPYLGDGAYGPIYDDPVTVRCLVDDTRRVVRDVDGTEAVSETTVFCQVDEPVTVQSRVNVNGRDTYVLAVSHRDGGGLPTPDHLEVACA